MKNIPILYLGAPGIGKTARVEQEYDHVEKLLTSSMVEEDIAGLIYREGQDERRTVPAFIRRLQKAVSEGKKTAMFLDEVDKGRREVVDTLLTLITNQEDYGVPQEVDIVLAANPPEWGGGDGVSIPLMNRISIIPVSPDLEGWVKWMKENYVAIWLEKVLERVAQGEIPLLESIGEDFERRITTPRSLTYSIQAYRDYPIEKAKVISDGLLTPNASSSLFLTVKNFGEKETIEEKINKTGTKLGAKKIIIKY